MQNARIVHQGVLSLYDGEATRDESMAENIRWILEQNPGSRMVLWAHNNHIAEAAESRFGARVPMGIFLADWYGDAYRSIGFVLGHGEYRGYDPDAGRVVEVELPPMQTGVGAALSQLESPLFFLSLDSVANTPEAAWLSQEQFARSIGAGVIQGSLRRMVLSDRFDGVIFVRAVTPSRGLRE